MTNNLTPAPAVPLPAVPLFTTGFSEERSSAYSKATRSFPHAREGEKTAVTRALNDLGLQKVERIVEIGAGQGFGTAMLREHLTEGGKIFAIDASEHMLANCSESPDVRKFVGSLEQLELGENSVDFAFSLAAFHHVPHKYLVMQELERVMKPGARLLIVDVCHGTPAQEIFDYVVRPFCPNGHDADFLDSDWAALLARRSKLDHVSSTISVTPWEFDSQEQLYDYAKDLFCLDIGIDRVKVELDKWLKPEPAANGRCSWPWSLGFHTFVKSAQ